MYVYVCRSLHIGRIRMDIDVHMHTMHLLTSSVHLQTNYQTVHGVYCA
jgi:hypothetical protein